MVIMASMLAADVLVWFGGRKFVQAINFVETAMDVLGSWPMLVLMSAFSVAWGYYVVHKHGSMELLDLVISIGTAQLDVVVLIGANFRARRIGRCCWRSSGCLSRAPGRIKLSSHRFKLYGKRLDLVRKSLDLRHVPPVEAGLERRV